MTSRSENIKCAKCKRLFNPFSVWRCRYSKSGAMICFWCCKKCQYIRRVENRWRCGFKEGE